MAWLPGMDLLFGGGLQAASVWDLAVLGVFAILAASSTRHVHVVGALVAWALFLSLLVAGGLGLAS